MDIYTAPLQETYSELSGALSPATAKENWLKTFLERREIVLGQQNSISGSPFQVEGQSQRKIDIVQAQSASEEPEATHELKSEGFDGRLNQKPVYRGLVFRH